MLATNEKVVAAMAHFEFRKCSQADLRNLPAKQRAFFREGYRTPRKIEELAVAWSGLPALE